jgi:hypothetical protein
MDAIAEFEKRLPQPQRAVFQGLKTPAAIQAYLDSLPYKAEELDRSPLRVMADGQGHCLDGGIFAAVALWKLGYRPLILDLAPEPGLDDDHVLAVYNVEGCWGCVAKSNFPLLRLREPVYRSLRELVMTYFDFYVSANREKSLRSYTHPLDLSHFKDPSWMWDEYGIRNVTRKLYSLKTIPVITEAHAAMMSLSDERTYKASTFDTDFSWTFGVRQGHENPTI